MPLPKPKQGEGEDAFIERCMANDTMNEEYPDTKQRLAVCYSQWRKEKDSMDMELERRFVQIEEVRAVVEDDTPHIRGYAAVFNKKSEDLGGFREVIRPGAFRKTIKEADVRALFNHDPNYVLGRSKNGTLGLKEDDKGLAIDITPPETTWARDLVASIERGDINQMSFGFRAIKDQWNDLEDDAKRTRELLEVELFDISAVTFPAYPQTSVAVRSFIETLEHPDPEPVPADHSEAPDADPPLARRQQRRRLELKAKA